MKSSFHARPLNGPFDDPGLYVRFIREGRSMMFDLGFTTTLSPRDILKTSDIFVSHTHVDHFIGFDNILRVSLKKEGPIRLYGPHGFIDCVEGKLGSYTWNLIRDYPLEIETTEIREHTLIKTRYRAKNGFVREDLGTEPFHDTILKDSFYSVSAAILDHQIPCLAFSLEEDYHINIDKSKLNALDLPVGPWLGELKKAIRGNKKNIPLAVNGKTYPLSELTGIANITAGQKLSYVVDAIGSDENIKRIKRLAEGSDVLYIEAYFLDDDRKQAKDRYHLTAREAGRIGREAGVKRIETIHFSPRYISTPEKLIQEAYDEFNKVK